MWCPGTELNRRHTDFQSVALPTELPGRAIAAHGARKCNGKPPRPDKRQTGREFARPAGRFRPQMRRILQDCRLRARRGGPLDGPRGAVRRADGRADGRADAHARRRSPGNADWARRTCDEARARAARREEARVRRVRRARAAGTASAWTPCSTPPSISRPSSSPMVPVKLDLDSAEGKETAAALRDPRGPVGPDHDSGRPARLPDAGVQERPRFLQRTPTRTSTPTASSPAASTPQDVATLPAAEALESGTRAVPAPRSGRRAAAPRSGPPRAKDATPAVRDEALELAGGGAARARAGRRLRGRRSRS